MVNNQMTTPTFSIRFILFGNPVLRNVILATSAISLLGGCSLMNRQNSSVLAPQTKKTSIAAQDSNAYDDRIRRHIYAGIGIGMSHLDPNDEEVDAFDVDERVQNGGQVALGIDISKHAAIELSAATLGSAGFSPSGSISYDVISGSALLYAGKNRHNYRRRGLNGYARIGYGQLTTEGTGGVPFVQDNATHILVGLGAEYMTRSGLGLRAEYISYEEDVKYGQLGLVYRFGKNHLIQSQLQKL